MQRMVTGDVEEVGSRQGGGRVVAGSGGVAKTTQLDGQILLMFEKVTVHDNPRICVATEAEFTSNLC